VRKNQPAETYRAPKLTSNRSVLLALGWYYPEVHRGVARFARDHHWHITADFDDPVPKHWNGDGVLTLLSAQQNLWRNLKPLRVPIVDLAESRPEIELPRVTMDNAAIGRMAAEYFIDRGYRNFAFVQRWALGVSRKRAQCFQETIQAHGHNYELLSWPRERKKYPDTRDSRHHWLMDRLAKLPKPLAVFARDTEAVEAIEACDAAKLSVPEQVAILGVDNTETICDCLRVPLSSIDARLEQVGYTGAALLDRLMRGETVREAPIYIPPAGVIERRSTQSLAVDHPKVAAALQFIHAHASDTISMSDIVQHVGMSRSGLEKAFREHFIRAPMEELRNIRLTNAKRMLRETKDTVVHIAYSTGFQTSHNLCRTFAQQVGQSPKQYRRNALEMQDTHSITPVSSRLGPKIEPKPR
jgi:LacI family transcriptional regulator